MYQGGAGLEEVVRELTIAAVRVHRGWAGRRGSPDYDGTLQQRLVREVLLGFLGEEGVEEALTPQQADEGSGC